jgi:beta-phosphoglucomutase family hydrolase
MSALKGVIWDMDGILVDTGKVHFQSWMDTLPDFEIPFTREIFNNTFGMNNEGILKLLRGEDFDPKIIADISERKEASFRRAIHGRLNTVPGVLTLLEAIRDANIPQAIGSSAPQKNIDAVVEELGLNNYFKALISAAEMPGKPNPAVFLTAAQKIHAPAAQCVVIEDAITGVEAARQAGMKCIAVTTTNTASSLQAANMVVDQLDELSVGDLISLFNESSDS